MRPLSIVVSLMFFLLFACKRHLSIAEMQQETRQTLQGHWQIEKRTLEIFDPYPTLKSETVYVGTTEDFFQFTGDATLRIGEAGKPVKEEHIYINVKQIVMPVTSYNNWFIDSLSKTRLVLSWMGRNDDSTYKTRREIIYFNKK